MNNQLPRKPRRPPTERNLKVVKPSYQGPPISVQTARPNRAMSLRPKNKSASLWYALCLPQLRADNDARSTEERLQQLAARLGRVSSTISLQSPDSLVFEVRSGLNYFGGIENIRSHVQALLEPLLASWGVGSGLQHAVSPTATASLLLARSGCNLLIYRKNNLRSALGSLPLDALVPPHAQVKAKNQTRRLRNSGLLVMRDLWRLPRQDLARRFGPDFLRQLDSCLGNVATPLNTYQDAPFFSTEMDFEYAVENTGFLLHAIDELLGRLCLYLRQRDLAAAHIQLRLRHEHREDTLIALEMRLASRSLSNLSLLLETRIQTLTLQAPVIGLQLEVQRFDSFTVQHEALSGVANTGERTDHSAILLLLEQLQARLGNDAVRNIHAHAEHGPEMAGSEKTFTYIASNSWSNMNTGDRCMSSKLPGTGPVAARPCWILKKPSPLRIKDLDRLQLLSGPERIETHWWDGQDIQRDYYVARNRQGMRLWIYHDRRGARDWHLHGIFD